VFSRFGLRAAGIPGRTAARGGFAAVGCRVDGARLDSLHGSRHDSAPRAQERGTWGAVMSWSLRKPIRSRHI
jgi:hypothetical protein